MTYRRLTLALGLALTSIASAQTTPTAKEEPWMKEIRAAEEHHLKVFRERDVAGLEKMLGDDFVVNSPRNTIIRRDELVEMVRSGALTFSAFEQRIEHIQRFGDIVTVMGADRVVWAEPAPNAGQTQNRRFTDLWRLEDGEWRFVARQATVLCQ
jgi:hypothetical protein